jgi:hypothetical protein
MTKSAERFEKIEHLEQALRSIALLGGNLHDDRLTGNTGPNDAAARGLMYTGARKIAMDALGIKTIEELWK